MSEIISLIPTVIGVAFGMTLLVRIMDELNLVIKWKRNDTYFDPDHFDDENSIEHKNNNDKCSYCGTRTDQTKPFCSQCGAPL